MEAYHDAQNYATDLKLPLKEKKVPQTSISYLPAYSLGQYEDICNAYFTQDLGTGQMQFDFKNVDGNDWSSLGYQKSVTKYGGGLFGIFGAKKSTEKEYSQFQSGSSSWLQNVTVRITTKGNPTLVQVNPGLWNVGNVRKTYPKLQPGRPDNLAGHAIITHILVAYEIAMEIEFKDVQTWKNVNSFVESGKSDAKGGLSIFGFYFGAGGGGSYQYSSSSLTTKTTENGGIIKIPSTPKGMIFMLGARGKAL